VSTRSGHLKILKDCFDVNFISRTQYVVLVEELHFKLYVGLSQIDMNHVFKLADETLISWNVLCNTSSVALCKYQSTIVSP